MFRLEVAFVDLAKNEHFNEVLISSALRKKEKWPFGTKYVLYSKKPNSEPYGEYLYVFAVDRLSTLRNAYSRLNAIVNHKHLNGSKSWAIAAYDCTSMMNEIHF
jgi:hypothetical protein